MIPILSDTINQMLQVDICQTIGDARIIGTQRSKQQTQRAGMTNGRTLESLYQIVGVRPRRSGIPDCSINRVADMGVRQSQEFSAALKFKH